MYLLEQTAREGHPTSYFLLPNPDSPSRPANEGLADWADGLCEEGQVCACPVESRQAKSSQVKSSQVKSSQVKPSQVKSSQVKPSQVKCTTSWGHEGDDEREMARRVLTPYSLLLTPYSLLLTSYFLLLTSYFLLLTPYFLLLTSVKPSVEASTSASR